MKRTGIVYCVFFLLCFVIGMSVNIFASEKKEAGTIDVKAEVGNTHPAIEPGLSCVDCHDFKLDAGTTATHIWLHGEMPGRPEGDGVMPEDILIKEIRKVIGGIKRDTKTYVLGTSLNNRPLTTTAEFTLDPKEMFLYGFHEQGTEKLDHIKNNPWVSLNYHKEFGGDFDKFLCCQIVGYAELIDGENPEFERILAEFLPYEEGARVPADATPDQREDHLKKFRQGIRKGFYISKTRIDRLTIINMDFIKNGFRRAQRWERRDNQE